MVDWKNDFLCKFFTWKCSFHTVFGKTWLGSQIENWKRRFWGSDCNKQTAPIDVIWEVWRVTSMYSKMQHFINISKLYKLVVPRAFFQSGQICTIWRCNKRGIFCLLAVADYNWCDYTLEPRNITCLAHKCHQSTLTVCICTIHYSPPQKKAHDFPCEMYHWALEIIGASTLYIHLWRPAAHRNPCLMAATSQLTVQISWGTRQLRNVWLWRLELWAVAMSRAELKRTARHHAVMQNGKD